MMQPDDGSPAARLFRPRRAAAVYMMAGMLLLAVLAAILLAIVAVAPVPEPFQSFVRRTALWGMVIGTVGAVCGAVGLRAGACWLRIDENGFTTCALFVQRHYRWADVESFGVARVRRNQLVGIRLAHGDTVPAVCRALRAATGFDGSLPSNFGLNPAELARILNESKNRFQSGEHEPDGH